MMKKLMSMLCTILFFASCEKAEKEIVINSSVLNSGKSSEVTDKKSVNDRGCATTSLEYSSWIRLQMETKAVKEQELSVLVSAKLSDLIDTIDVRSLNIFNTITNVLDYQENESRVENNVTIIDSSMIYKVDFSGDLTFTYDLNFEVPVYNDGFTNQIMPYHRVKFVNSNDFEVQETDPIIDGTKIYACRIVKHSIVVSFNEKKYVVHATILCRKLVSSDGQAAIVTSKVVDEGKELIYTDHLSFRTWLKMKHSWSDNTMTEVVYDANVSHNVEFDQSDILAKVILSSDLEFSQPKFLETTAKGQGGGNKEVIKRSPRKSKYVVSCKEFSVHFYADGDFPVYDDGLLYHYMPIFPYVGHYRLEHRIESEGDDIHNGKEAACYCLWLTLFRTLEGKEYKVKEQPIWLYKYK